MLFTLTLQCYLRWGYNATLYRCSHGINFMLQMHLQKQDPSLSICLVVYRMLRLFLPLKPRLN